MAEPLGREIEGLRALFRSERDPEGRAFVPLADALRRIQDFQGAIEVLEEGLGRHPTLASAHVVAAWVHRDRGDRSTARAAWKRVLELDDENVEALRGLATLLLESGRVDEARPYLDRVRSLDPDDPDVLGQFGDAPAPPLPEDAALPDLQSPPSDVEPAATGDQPAAYDEIAIERIVALAEAATAGASEGQVQPAPEAEEEALSPGGDSLAESAAASTLESLTPQGPEGAAGVGEPEEPGEGAGPDEPLVIAAGAEALFADGEILEVWSDHSPEDEEPAELPATRTLAELYARQGLLERAAETYARLAEESPADAAIQTRLDELGALLRPSAPAPPPPSVHAADTEVLAEHMSGDAHADTAASPFWTPEEEAEEESEHAGEPISEYFRRLLGWSPSKDPEGGAAVERGEGASTGGWDAGAERSAGSIAPAAMVAIGSPAPGGVVAIEAPTPDGVVPIESLAPDGVVPIASLAPDAVPIASLAPDAVPIESLAPDAEPSGGRSTILY